MVAVAGLLLCLSHISPAAGCQHFLRPRPQYLPVCPLALCSANYVSVTQPAVLFLHILCEGVCFCRDTPEHNPVKSSVCGKLCTLSCPYLNALEMRRVPSFVSIKCEVQKMDAEMIEGEIRGAYILYIHHRSAFSVFRHIMSPCSLKIC